MPLAYALLVAVHVSANLVWIGSILSVAALLSSARLMASPSDVGAVARRVYVRLAAPAFVISFGAGLARFFSTLHVYAHLPWMHAKLTFALAVIVLHHVLGARARRLASGTEGASRGAVGLGLVTFACAAGAVFCAILRF